MTKAKTIKTVSAALGRPGTTTGRVSGAKINTSQTPQTARKVIHAQVPEGIDMDQFLDQLVQHMQNAQLANLPASVGGDSTAVNLQEGRSVANSQSSMTDLQAAPAPYSPIDGSLEDLQATVETLSAQLSLLVQRVEPILRYESELAESAVKCGSSPASSPLQNRLIFLNVQLKDLVEKVTTTSGRVQI